MKCQIYPAMQLGGAPPQLIQQAMDGVADIVWTLPGYTAGRFPIMEVFELPFMSRSAEATSQAAWDYYTQYGYKEFPGHQGARRQRARQRLRPHGQQAGQDDGRFQGPQDARADAADEQAARRAWAQRRSRCRCRRSATRCRRASSTATCCPWEVIPSIKAHEFTKFESETDPKSRALYTAVFILAMNQAKYDSLPADLKQVIDANSGAALSKTMGKTWDASAPPARKLAVDRGNTFYVIPASELEQLAEGHGEPRRRMGARTSAPRARTARCCCRPRRT